LIAERHSRGVFKARPGITGLAQVINIDMSKPKPTDFIHFNLSKGTFT